MKGAVPSDPSASVALIVTVCESLRPEVSARVQVQEPSGLAVMAPSGVRSLATLNSS